LEHKPTFECHPSVIQVYNKVLEFIWKRYLSNKG
jgi:hypothetical protein